MGISAFVAFVDAFVVLKDVGVGNGFKCALCCFSLAYIFWSCCTMQYNVHINNYRFI